MFITDENNELKTTDVTRTKEKLKNPIFSPTKKGQKKPKNTLYQQVINLLYQKVVGKDKYNLKLTGIFFEKGQIIASDSRILAIIKMDYPKENEGKIIDKEGNTINEKYVNYNNVMPDLYYYKKIDKPNFAMNFMQGDLQDQHKWYDFVVNKKMIDTAKKIFEKFKETPTLYLPPEKTIPKPIVLKSKTVYILAMPLANR